MKEALREYMAARREARYERRFGRMDNVRALDEKAAQLYRKLTPAQREKVDKMLQASYV